MIPPATVEAFYLACTPLRDAQAHGAWPTKTDYEEAIEAFLRAIACEHCGASLWEHTDC